MRVKQMFDICQEKILSETIPAETFGRVAQSEYLCVVFFIVLDLRLTRFWTQRSPFFLPLTQVRRPQRLLATRDDTTRESPRHPSPTQRNRPLIRSPHRHHPYSTDAHTQQPDLTAARHPSTPPTNPKTTETQDILTAKHETEKSNHETITASHEMIMVNRETKISHIATKIIEA